MQVALQGRRSKAACSLACRLGRIQRKPQSLRRRACSRDGHYSQCLRYCSQPRCEVRLRLLSTHLQTVKHKDGTVARTVNRSMLRPHNSCTMQLGTQAVHLGLWAVSHATCQRKPASKVHSTLLHSLQSVLAEEVPPMPKALMCLQLMPLNRVCQSSYLNTDMLQQLRKRPLSLQHLPLLAVRKRLTLQAWLK